MAKRMTKAELLVWLEKRSVEVQGLQLRIGGFEEELKKEKEKSHTFWCKKEEFRMEVLAGEKRFEELKKESDEVRPLLGEVFLLLGEKTTECNKANLELKNVIERYQRSFEQNHKLVDSLMTLIERIGRED